MELGADGRSEMLNLGGSTKERLFLGISERCAIYEVMDWLQRGPRYFREGWLVLGVLVVVIDFLDGWRRVEWVESDLAVRVGRQELGSRSGSDLFLSTERFSSNRRSHGRKLG
jgi:hypothetical protein